MDKQPSLFDTPPSQVSGSPATDVKLVLRPYQEEAVRRILWAQKLAGNDLCVLPTGSGKSVVIASIAKELKQPILILQPSKEILEQNHAKLRHYVDTSEIGIYSASMKQKEVRFYTFATIQSIYQKPEQFQHFGVVVIDECHLVNPKNLEGMFTSFLKQIGNPKVIGFTATPYRLATGYVWESVEDESGTHRELTAATAIKLINRTKERFWSRIIFNINNHELLEKGYLCPLEYIDRSVIEHSEIPINKSMSDFDLEQFEHELSKRETEIIKTLEYATQMAHSVLVFCSSTKQAEKMCGFIQGSAFVTSATTAAERERIIQDFKAHKIQVVFNYGVLTTGFDHPALDCIVLIRPTRSIALYYQMLGRGVRRADGKLSCKVIDLTSTVRNLGKIETIRLVKLDDKWELISETGSWHNRQLYSYKIKDIYPKTSPLQDNSDSDSL